jgi:hypothetical protein
MAALPVLTELDTVLADAFTGGSTLVKANKRLVQYITPLQQLGNRAPVFSELASRLEKVVADGTPEHLLEIELLLRSLRSSQLKTNTEMPAQEPTYSSKPFVPTGLSYLDTKKAELLITLFKSKLNKAKTELTITRFIRSSKLDIPGTGIQFAVPGTIVIPDTIDGIPVTAINDSVFSGCYTLTAITLPSGLTSIGNYAFCHCSSLTEVVIPAHVKNIGDEAFSGCSALSAITIPAEVINIGKNAFKDCTALPLPLKIGLEIKRQYGKHVL